ncbi:MAG: efflux transporter outer membrane subunit [Verrucomicrobia bacterium]|nr:efflux transporter outer membrane subunit [Verrucomicrobiota bacterium]
MPPRSELILALALLAGCAGAPGVKPAAPVAPMAFTAAGAPAGAGWTEAFADPALKELVVRARRVSPDLAVARARHREALALLRAEGAGDEPALTASAGVESSRISVANGRFPPGIPRRTDVTAVGLRASWELDFWGRQASAVRAAAEDARAAALTSDQADLALTAEVARLWFAVRAAREQAACLSQEFIAREREMRILEKSVAAGILPGDPLSSARLAAAQAKVDEGLGLRRLAAAENALRALIAADPGFALPASGAPAAMPTFGPGLPSDLLLRRPDLAAAAARFDAAVAREGAALADFYPSVTLGGQAGWQADPASRIGKGAAGFWSLAPTVDLPLFDAGRREAGLEAARARLDGAAAEWTRAVLNAFREVEDALADLRELALQEELTARVVEAARDRLRNAEVRHRAGVASEAEVIANARDEALARRTLAGVVWERRQAAVRLAAATGGGWSEPR